jgi:DNA-binding HxlR family transcriptional regulator
MVRAPHFTSAECPPELHVIDAISGKWTVLVVYILSDGPVRHGQLQRLIGGISQKVLTQTLRNLERHGVVKRTVYPVVPPQVDYDLTRLGRSLVGVLSDVCLWAKKHYDEVDLARKRYDKVKA